MTGLVRSNETVKGKPRFATVSAIDPVLSNNAMTIQYQFGFRNDFATEALPNALPTGQNSPQRCPYGLYAEQLSGSAFTAPHEQNVRSWLYRIRPSVMQGEYRQQEFVNFKSAPLNNATVSPNPLRWNPLPEPSADTDFLDGMYTVCANGDAAAQSGVCVHLYVLNHSMTRYFCNADGEMLFVPQAGELILRTEMGSLEVAPGEIASIPRGVKFQVNKTQDTQTARGYVCENYARPFELPSLGAIGSNGLANSRDFLAPVAAYEEVQGGFEIVVKMHGRIFSAKLSHSPFDVVAWHGNYAPYKYDLAKFMVINSVSFDHPDPSIFTVLTSPSELTGTANCDFVIFPPRWIVAENTFRPPWFHRNIMSEFMGLVKGSYDAKAEGFVPGGSSLHNCMTPHGPDSESFEKASRAKLKPVYQDNTLAFMFESRHVFVPTVAAMEADFRQQNYSEIWQSLKSHFSPDHI